MRTEWQGSFYQVLTLLICYGLLPSCSSSLFSSHPSSFLPLLLPVSMAPSHMLCLVLNPGTGLLHSTPALDRQRVTWLLSFGAASAPGAWLGLPTVWHHAQGIRSLTLTSPQQLQVDTTVHCVSKKSPKVNDKVTRLVWVLWVVCPPHIAVAHLSYICHLSYL